MRLTSLSPIAGALLLAPPAFAQSSPEPAMAKAGCTACHTKDRKLVGPSYKDIAAKYKGQAGAAAALADKVRRGGKGNFGVIPMPPVMARICRSRVEAIFSLIIRAASV